MLTKSTAQTAGIVTGQLTDAVNNTLARVQQVLANGVAANPQAGTPALTAAQITAEIDPVVLAKLQAILTIFGSTTATAAQITAAVSTIN